MKDHEMLFRPPLLDARQNEEATSDAYFENDIGRFPLLNEKEEYDLSSQIECGKVAAIRLSDEIDLSEERQRELEHIKKIGEAARARMISSNMRLVLHWANRAGRPPELRMDLAQEGAIGLIRAVEKYDRHKGHRFSTYATWWIKQSIHRSLPGYEDLRMPIHNHDIKHKILKLREDYLKVCGTEPTLSDLAEMTGVPIKTVNIVMRNYSFSSLDKPAYGTAKETAGDRQITNPEGAEVEALSTLNYDQLNEIMEEHLTDRQRFVVTEYVLGCKTYHEIGQELGVTRERIRQIFKESILLLRKHRNVRAMRERS